MTLAEQVNQRRMARGREPLMLWHVERAIRFVAGPKPPQGRVELDRRNCELSNLMLFPDSRTHMLCHWGKLSDAQLRSFSLV